MLRNENGGRARALPPLRLLLPVTATVESGEARFGFFGQSCKSHLIADRDIRQHLAVDVDIGFLQTVDETAVRHAKLTRTGVDTHNPQATELTLALAAVTVRILASLDDGLDGNTIHTAAGTVVTLCHFQNFLVSATRLDTTFYSSHWSHSPEVRYA